MDKLHKVEVQNGPSEYISDIVLIDEKSQFLVTAWDGSLSQFEYNPNLKEVRLIKKVVHEYALLCCCYAFVLGKLRVYVGTVQGEIFLVDFENSDFKPVLGNSTQLGVSKMVNVGNYTFIASSWDGILQEIDMQDNAVIRTTKLENNTKVLAMDCVNNLLILALTGKKIRWLNLPLNNNDRGEVTEVETGLKYQVRDIKLTLEGDGYVTSSIDGRVAVEYFEDDSRNFAFRCHRMNLVDMQFVFPVNSLAFSPASHLLFTGGSDGCVSLWNLETHKKIKQFPKFNENSVVKLACNEDILVVGTSDDSFKTNAVVAEPLELQSSRLYVLFKE
ncbi:hypothetical protein NCAS_0A07160 [Naumovozyma castellii]|uniref:Uncharacterized protein n=1 Tax=Naumovozyma castellii TaxID=27288 RepID=G0V726_NAUCA|nr:hypothetical protein NCAS_0A07160 [Naumovozyma castellii CBS 4309]CCC67274.1 hypothetical protein NCAS_0A07160 [Naumovozyma castellii CBS 4309]